jgi:hypothetical protein
MEEVMVSKSEGGGGGLKCEVLKRLFDVLSTRARRERGRGHITSDDILCMLLVLILDLR